MIKFCSSAQLGKEIYLSILKIHVMSPITKPESLELLEFSKLPLDTIQDWHN